MECLLKLLSYVYNSRCYLVASFFITTLHTSSLDYQGTGINKQNKPWPLENLTSAVPGAEHCFCPCSLIPTYGSYFPTQSSKWCIYPTSLCDRAVPLGSLNRQLLKAMEGNCLPGTRNPLLGRTQSNCAQVSGKIIPTFSLHQLFRLCLYENLLVTCTYIVVLAFPHLLVEGRFTGSEHTSNFSP